MLNAAHSKRAHPIVSRRVWDADETKIMILVKRAKGGRAPVYTNWARQVGVIPSEAATEQVKTCACMRGTSYSISQVCILRALGEGGQDCRTHMDCRSATKERMAWNMAYCVGIVLPSRVPSAY